MPLFLNILKKWIGDCYDYLGLVLVSSIIWFGIVLGGFAAIVKTGNPVIIAAASALFYALLIAPLTAGIFAMAKRIATRDEPSLLNLLSGFKEYLTASWALGFIQIIVTILIVGNTYFYLTRDALAVKLLGFLFLYLLTFWMFSAVYHYPVLIEQRPGVLKIIKRGFLLTMGNVVFTVGVFFVIILLTCFCAVTLLGLPLLFIGMMSLFQTRALRMLFEKYGLLKNT